MTDRSIQVVMTENAWDGPTLLADGTTQTLTASLAGSLVQDGKARYVNPSDQTSLPGFYGNLDTHADEHAAMGVAPKFATRKIKVGVGGDSISWGVDNRAYPRSDWSAVDGVWGAVATPNLGGFISLLHPDGKCLSGESVTLSWNGVSTLNVAIAGDIPGLPVDVTGGGFFHLNSGTNGKGAMVVVRWLTSRPSAASDTGTVSGSKVVNKYHFDQWWSCGFARQGAGFNVDFRNFGVTSDTPANFLSRIGQIEDEDLDAFFLLIGANNDTQTSEINSCIDRLSASCKLVVVAPVFPSGSLGTTALAQARAKAWRTTAEYAKTKNNCVVFNGWDVLADPSGTSGSGLVDTSKFHTDYVHLNPLADVVLGDKLFTEVIYPFFSNISGLGASGHDAYNSTNNPYGNFLSTVGAMVGTTGTLGTNPVATGQLATGWTDAAYSTVNPWASVVYSKVAREGNRKGEFQRVVCTNAGVGGAGRQITASIPNLAAGQSVRFRIPIRLSNTTLMNRFVAQIRLDAPSGNIYAMAINLGRAQTSGGTINSQWYYFDTGSVVVPNDFTSGAVYIQIGCAQGGSITFDWDDVVVECVPPSF